MTRQVWEQGLGPLETAYRGYRMRSRLEARWAVFFDALGVPWEYEPEGFATPTGPYLPDFRLWGSLYAEVKPVTLGPDPVAVAESLLDHTIGLDRLLVLLGAPSLIFYPLLFAEPLQCDWLDFQASHLAGEPRYYYAPKRPSSELLAYPPLRFERAVLAARGARLKGGLFMSEPNSRQRAW